MPTGSSRSDSAHRSPPCDACRAAKVRCDLGRPACAICVRRDTPCVYSRDQDMSAGRVRKFAKRSRAGCLECRARRIRCGEEKPVCHNCAKAKKHDTCVYSSQRASRSTSPPVISLDPPGRATAGKTTAPNTAGWHHDWALETISYPPAAAPQLQAPLDLDKPFDLLGNSFGNLGGLFEVPLQQVHESSYLGTGIRHGRSSFPLGPGPFYPQSLNSTSQLVQYAQPDLTAFAPFPPSPSTAALIELVSGTVSSEEVPALSDTTQSPPISTLAESPLVQAFFETLEQRHQFAHFVEETAPALLVVDAGPADNPWLAQVVPLALAENSKGSLSHGLLRSAILSLSLAHMSLQPGGSSDSSTNDRLLAHSNESKRQIMSQLEALETLDMFEDGGVDLDALLATVWAITARDRLAGSEDWEAPLEWAIRLLARYGGPITFLAIQHTVLTRSLVEQLATAEVMACITTMRPPEMLKGDCKWLMDGETGTNDSLCVTYGWTRSVIRHTVRTINLSNDYINIRRIGGSKDIHSAMRQNIIKRMAGITLNVSLLKQDSLRLHLATEAANVHGTVKLASECLILIMDQLVHHVLTDFAFSDGVARAFAARMIMLISQATSRGAFTGFLLPLTWAAAFSPADGKASLVAQQSLFDTHYLVERRFLQRILRVDWTTFTVWLSDFCNMLKKHRLFVPIL